MGFSLASIKTRGGLTITTWLIGFLLITGLIIGDAFLDRSWMLAFFIIISLIRKFEVLIL